MKLARIALALLLGLGVAAPALAQQPQQTTLINPPTESTAMSPGGVNLRNGGYAYNEIDLAIGGEGGLTLSRTMSEFIPGHGNPFGNLSHNWDITLSEVVNQQQGDLTYRIRINFGGRSQTFKSPYPSTGFGPETVGPLSTLTYTGSRASNSIVYTYTAADGSVAVFNQLGALGNGQCSFERRCAFISTLTEADGTVYTFDYAPGGGSGGTVWLKSVTSSRGYALLFEGTANRITKACVINLSLGTLPSTCPSGALATSTYTYTTSGDVRLTGATGPDNETSTFTYGSGGMGFVRPGETSAWQTIGLISMGVDENDMVRPVVDEQSFVNGLTYGYSYVTSPVTDNRPNPAIAGGFYSYNDGQAHTVEMPYDFPLADTPGNPGSTCYPAICPIDMPDDFQHWIYQQTPGPIQITDELNRTTRFNYCDPAVMAGTGHCAVVPLVSFTDPEGAVTELQYGGSGNITQVTRHARPGSLQPNGQPWPNIVTSATYDTGNIRSQNKPLTMTDARGNVTTYTYDTAHGGMRTMTGPAVNGVSPQTRNSYTLRKAWISNGSGGYTQVAAGTYLLTATSSCRTSAASTTSQYAPCSVAGDEVLTSYDYGPDSGPNTLLLRGQTVTSTDGGVATTLRTCYAYDALGRRISETSPNAFLTSCPGTPPTTALPYTNSTRYDAGNRVTGTISADPDQGGWLPFLAVRNTYDAAGRITKVETGTLSAWQSEAVAPSAWTGFTVSRSIETRYDAMGRKQREWARAGSAGTVETLTEYKYDLRGRLLCTAIRMNQNRFTYSGASDACTPTNQGNETPDRISRNVYDAAGQLVQHRVGVGTLEEGADATFAYNNAGQRTVVIDGNGNRAELRYDGHGRQDRWTFPSTTRPSNYNDATQATALNTAGSANAADYEEYGYDPNGNRTSLRKRDNATLAYGNITYDYDALNRLTLKTVPARASGGQALTSAQTRDVYYGYDLRNLQLYARFDSTSGDGVSSTYDGFGRMLSSRIVMGSSDRALSYQYDRNGNRLRVTHPDTNYFSYEYDQSARLNYIRENGAASGIGVLATIGYADYGPVGAVVPSNGMITAFGYDGIGRQNMLLHDMTGSGGTGDVTWTYGRNAASQIAGQTRTNDAYAWGGHYAVTRAYTTDGLNRYTTAGGASFTYDANGDLITTPGSHPNETITYVYDVENRLVGASSSTGQTPTVTLFYDPLGRLFSSTVSGTTTEFLYDGDALVGEYVGSNLTERYVHGSNSGADDPLVWYHGSGLTDRRWLHADHQGSIVATSNGTGAVGTIYTYDEYGIPGQTSSDRFRYTGQIWLPELGMYHYKARVYSPYLGRFLQIDPIGYHDQYNLYAYVGDDPINETDPTGMCFENCSVGSGNARADQITRYAETGRNADGVPYNSGTDMIMTAVTVLTGVAIVVDVLDGPTPDIGAAAASGRAALGRSLGWGTRPAAGTRTFSGQVRDAATRAGGNPTVRRGGQDIVRLRPSGHGSPRPSATPQNVRRVNPQTGEARMGRGPDRPVSPRDMRELYKARDGQGTSEIRTRGGACVGIGHCN